MDFNGNSKPLVLLLIDDLIFVSKVSLAAKETGVATRALTRGDVDEIDRLVPLANLVIVDLNSETVNPIEFLRAVTALESGRTVQIICFGSHVSTELLREAQSFPDVTTMSRSQFVQQLSEILQGVKES